MTSLAAIALALAATVFLLRALRGRNALRGPAYVLDGDTLEVAGTRIRLHGVDAPEHDQLCGLPNGRLWPCGEAAIHHLRTLVRGQIVTCRVRGADTYGRTIAICRTADGVDLGEALVASGYALAYRRYSHRYIMAERSARRVRRGVWASAFHHPAAWRAAKQGR